MSKARSSRLRPHNRQLPRGGTAKPPTTPFRGVVAVGSSDARDFIGARPGHSPRKGECPMSDKRLKSLLNRYPSLAQAVERLARIPRPVAGPPRPVEQELLLIPPDPSEGRAPR